MTAGMCLDSQKMKLPLSKLFEYAMVTHLEFSKSLNHSTSNNVVVSRNWSLPPFAKDESATTVCCFKD